MYTKSHLIDHFIHDSDDDTAVPRLCPFCWAIYSNLRYPKLTNRKTDRQTDRQTDRHRQTNRQTQTDRQTVS